MNGDPQSAIRNPRCFLWLLLGLLLVSSLLSGCSTVDRNNTLEDFRRDLTESDKGVVRALVDKFDRWLAPDEFGLSPTLMRIAQGVGGFLLLFAGYALYKVAVMLGGFIVGAIMGYGFGSEEGGRLLGILLLLVGGWLGGVLAWFLHMLAIFAVGAFYGAILLAALIDWETWVLLLGGVLGGILLLALSQLIIVLITASTGAVLFGGLALGASDTIILILFAVGVLVQYGMLASRKEEEEKKEKEKAKNAPAD
jgi:hypothetical protein